MQKYLSRLLEPKANGPEATIMLVSLLGVNISNTTLKKEIEEHPDYPSLLGISDVLNRYGVENMGIKLDKNLFSEIPTPFIAQIKGKLNPIDFFTVVKEINDDTFCFFDPEKHRWSSLKSDEFFKRSSEIVLLAEANENAGESDYILKTKLEKRRNAYQALIACLVPVLVIILGITNILKNGQYSVLPVIFSLLTLLGCIIGILLIWYEIDQHNPLLQQICSSNKKINCGAVLNSKASKIAGISWSTLGLSYFIGLLFLSVFSGFNNQEILYIVGWIATLGSAYVVFSIFYQKFVIKQWCVMCLFVQGILLVQLLIVLLGNWHSLSSISTIGFEPILKILFAFSVPLVLIMSALPILRKAKEYKETSLSLQKLKHNKQVFESLLQKQKSMLENPLGLGISLGNPNGKYKLIKICNPYCGPCAKAHPAIEQLLHHHPELGVQIIFTATNSENDIRASPVKHLLAIASNNDEAATKQALDDWYLPEKKDYKVFAENHPINGKLEEQDVKIQAMQNWCEKVNIRFTPTYFVAIIKDENGELQKYHQLPAHYQIEDLKYFFSE